MNNNNATAVTVTADEIALIGGDAGKNRAAAIKAKEFAVVNHLPLDGVTVLGGKVYINNKGLTIMLRRDERGPGSVALDVVKDAWDDCDTAAVVKRMGSTSREAVASWPFAGLMRAKCKATVRFPDGTAYEAFGDASIITIGMAGLHNPDYVNMMSETRAVNRAIRRATGLDTTAEELADGADATAIDGAVVRVVESQTEQGTDALRKEIAALLAKDEAAANGLQGTDWALWPAAKLEETAKRLRKRAQDRAAPAPAPDPVAIEGEVVGDQPADDAPIGHTTAFVKWESVITKATARHDVIAALDDAMLDLSEEEYAQLDALADARFESLPEEAAAVTA